MAIDDKILQISFFFQIPICSSTGGLVDTVKEGVTGFHMGSFNVEVKHSRQPPTLFLSCALKK